MIIDGKKIASSIKDELKEKILSLKIKPALAVILVGNNPASMSYIRMKKRACEKVGITFTLIHYPENLEEKKILDKIEELNHDKNTNGILVQMPLPKQINPFKVIQKISPEKDVDGFHPINVGKMLIGIEGSFLPCTPLGIKILLQKSMINIEGKHVVIVGRSNIVGKPLAAILLQKHTGANATVTIAHSYSKNLKEITKSADILVAAIGKPKFITKDMVKKDAVIIDVGVNHIKENGKTKMIGDVDFENVKKLASYITPVPKGVGPMTIAMLLSNVFKSYLKKNL